MSFRHGTSKQIYNIIDRFGVSYCFRSCVFSLKMMRMRDYKFICTTRETRRDMHNVHACHTKKPPIIYCYISCQDCVPIYSVSKPIELRIMYNKHSYIKVNK